MKKFIIITSSIFLWIYLFLILTYLAFSNMPGGCYPIENLSVNYTLDNVPKCMDVKVINSCGGTVAIIAKHSCKEIFLIEENNKTIELYNSEQYKLTKNITHPTNTHYQKYYYSEYGLSNIYGNYSKTINYKNSSKNMTINWENKFKEENLKSDNGLMIFPALLTILILPYSLIMGIGLLIIYVSKKR